MSSCVVRLKLVGESTEGLRVRRCPIIRDYILITSHKESESQKLSFIT